MSRDEAGFEPRVRGPRATRAESIPFEPYLLADPVTQSCAAGRIVGVARLRTVLPLVLMAAVLVGGLALFAVRVRGPSDATVVALSDRLAGRTLVVEAVLDPTSSLHAGDVVRAVEGHAVDRVGPGVVRAGQVLTYTVERDGATTDVAVRLTPRWPAAQWARRNWPALLLAVGLIGMAAVVFRRRPTDPAAAALLAVAALAGVGVPGFVLGGEVVDLVRGRDLMWCAFGELCLALLWAAWLLFVLVFPEPMSGRRVRQLVVLCVGAFLVVEGVYLTVVLADAPDPVVAGWRLLELSYPSGYVFPVVIVVVLIGRFLRARGTSAARYLGWLVAAFSFGGAGYYLVWQLPVAVRGAPLLDWDLVPLAFLPCVATLGAAVLRFGLFDIKAVARRAVVYATLTLAVIIGYAGFVAIAGSLVTTGPVLAPPLVATVVIAVLFQPLKDRVQRSVSRLLYGTRDEPYTALARLGERLESAAAGGAVLDSIARTVATALKVPYVATELCAADGSVLRRVDHGRRTSSCSVFPAVSGGLLVGKLLVGPRTHETAFAQSELRLLADLARQSAPALQALQLAVELEDSRQRLVRAGAEERRRIQRDLHDGIGPSLAGLRMQIGSARALLARGSTKEVATVLQEIERQVVDCTTDVRELLVVLRSPLLDTLGLLGALRHQAQRLGAHSHVRIVVDALNELPALPAAVEEATLAIASEAMTNALRHSRANRCLVTIAVGEELELTVTDNGRGVTASSNLESGTGIGLHGMRQRAVEIGGSCQVQPAAGGGTQVYAVLPLTVQS